MSCTGRLTDKWVLDSLNRDEVRDVVDHLATYFGCQMPEVHFRKHSPTHGESGVCVNGTAQITLGVRGSVLYTVLHEFAHILDALTQTENEKKKELENLILLRSRRMNPEKREEALNHGESFYFWLKEVVAYAGIDNYPWNHEYDCLKRWAIRDGLCGGGD